MHFGQVEATIYYEHIKNTQRSQLFLGSKGFLALMWKKILHWSDVAEHEHVGNKILRKSVEKQAALYFDGLP